jgi:hypothetical protein
MEHIEPSAHRSPDRSRDREELAWQEIDLLADAMIAGAVADHRLSSPELDKALGLGPSGRIQGAPHLG